jgi:hypothetical protein
MPVQDLARDLAEDAADLLVPLVTSSPNAALSVLMFSLNAIAAYLLLDG